MSEIQEKNLELKEWISRKVFALFLGYPIFWLGFSEMYYPKYQASDWFIVVCSIAFLISMSYFFEKQTSFVARNITQFYTKKSDNTDDNI